MGTGRLLSTRLIPRGPGLLEIEDAELRVTAGPDRGLRHALGGEAIRIGSAADCQLVLHDASVSAHHAEIVPGESGYSIRDLGSKNGIVVGDFRVERAPLADRMKLVLGLTTLVVRTLGQKLAIPLSDAGVFHGLCAHSASMRAVVAALARFADAEITVLIEGETGSGKEMVAEALHRASLRADGPFVVFDCGALAPSLAAAELFGHERGAFSGADRARAGLLEQAAGGTLFLDEIGELGLDLQQVLLRAIESKRSRRIGGKEEVTHDVRVVAATHRNLAEEVRARRFRKDLYFRLAVGRLRIPPLRERAEDIAPLAHQFAGELGLTLSPELLGLLAAYHWPGNVRELRNTVGRLAVHPGEARLLLGTDEKVWDWEQARRRTIETFEHAHVEKLLAHTGGSVSRAAELANISRQLLHRLAARYGLLPPRQR